MDMMREGNSCIRPPLLEGNANYGFCKARMRSFIKQLDEHAWKAIVFGWEVPTTVDKDGKSTEIPEDKWTEEHNKKSKANSKALNTITAGVTMNVYRRNEDEADYIGMMLMASAGYEPSKALDFFNKGISDYYFSFLKTHPSSSERAKKLNRDEVMNNAQELYKAAIAHSP